MSRMPLPSCCRKPTPFRVRSISPSRCGNFYENIRGQLAIQGGVGNDVLVIEDDHGPIADLSPRHHYFENDWLIPEIGQLFGQYYLSEFIIDPSQKTLVTSASLFFRDVASLELQADGRNNEFYVNGTIAGASYTLRGNDGRDEFLIDAAGLRSNVTVQGGNPTATPGDELHNVGTGSERVRYTPRPANSHSGTVETLEQADVPRIEFTGLESVSLEHFGYVEFNSPLSQDDLTLMPFEGGLRVSGSSTNPIAVLTSNGTIPPPLVDVAWKALDLKSVSEIVLNLARNDLQPLTLGQWTYLPLPHDVAHVLPGALSQPSIGSVLLVMGPGSNLVHDYTLESTDSATSQFTVSGFTNAVMGGISTHVRHDRPGVIFRLVLPVEFHRVKPLCPGFPG